MPTKRVIGIRILRVLEWGCYVLSGLLLVLLVIRYIWLMAQEPYGLKAMMGFAQEVEGFEPVTLLKVIWDYFIVIPAIVLSPALLALFLHFIVVRCNKRKEKDEVSDL